jgi:deoxyadenosine/deoxycytidine kinase/NTP pyrophosphatase (non-canonical NTP hydrolase)
MSRESEPGSWYVAIEGAIGVGKTTLARMLRDHLDTGLLLEVFEENPFLSKFYESRARYAFQTQMFFLLSRYRQQQQVAHLLEQNALISDYMFAKDRLFAALNLVGDEWAIYEQLHGALALQIPPPDLVVYLQADTTVLMARIAQRDRPYERDMDREYIDDLRQAYERFFEGYRDTPVLAIDTNDLNFVGAPADFQVIAGQIRSTLKEGSYQQRLPQFQGLTGVQSRPNQPGTLAEYQRFHVEMDRTKRFITDPYFNYLCLSEEMGELGSELAQVWREEARLLQIGQDQAQARKSVLAARRQNLEEELADCMAYLLKLANYAGVDLEVAYENKMRINQTRTWRG